MEEQEGQDLVGIDDYRGYDRASKQTVFLSPEHEVKYRKEVLEWNNQDVSAYDALGIAGKVGLAYLGLRAMGLLAGFGPEINAEEPAIFDCVGATLAYLGGACWLSARILSLDRRIAKRDYESALERLSEQSPNSLKVVGGET